MASRTLQISEKDIRQERRIVWPSLDVCKGRNYSKGNKFYLRFPPCRSLNDAASEDEQGSAKENAELLCGFVYGGPVRTHEHPSEAMPLHSPGDAANLRIAEADTGNLT